MATKKGTMFPIFMNIEFNIRQFICTFKKKKDFYKDYRKGISDTIDAFKNWRIVDEWC